MPKTRDPIFDIMKGFAILFVVMSHTFFPDISNKVFVSLRSPLFFLVSGYFAKEWFFFDFIKNGAKRLLIPLLFTYLLMIPIVIMLDYLLETNVILIALKSMALGTSSWDPPGSNVSQISAGPLWFVWSSILVRIYWSFLQKWGGNWMLGISIFLLAIIAYHVKMYVTLPFSILSSFGALGFFYVGYIIKKHSLLENEKGKQFFPICLLCLFYCICFSRIDVNFCVYNAFYIIDVLGCVATFFILHKVIKNYYYENRFWNFIQFVGRYSLVALCVHSIDQCIWVDWSPFKLWYFFQTNFELTCAYLIRILFVVSITYLISKNQFLREKIFFIK